MAHKNKIAGSKWNYEVINFFAKVFNLVPFDNKNHSEFNISTAQAMSKPLDGMGVDVYFSPLLPNWMTNIYVQCKKTLIQAKTTYTIDVKPLLDMKVNKGVNLLFTKVTKRELTKKGLVSKKESVVCNLVTMEIETFEVFLEAYKNYSLYKQNIDEVIQKVKELNKWIPDIDLPMGSIGVITDNECNRENKSVQSFTKS